MKTCIIKLYTTTVNETYAIIAQLNNIAGTNNPAAPFAKYIAIASKENSTTTIVKLNDVTKQQAIQVLRELVHTYQCFHATGDVRFYDALTKRDIKLISMPVPEDYMQETLDKLNNTYHLKLTEKDLC